MIYSLNMVISFASFRYCRILSFYQWYCPNISCLFSWQCYLTVLHHSTPRLSCFSCVTSQGCHDSSGLASTGAGSRTHPGWKNPRVFARFFFKWIYGCVLGSDPNPYSFRDGIPEYRPQNRHDIVERRFIFGRCQSDGREKTPWDTPSHLSWCYPESKMSQEFGPLFFWPTKHPFCAKGPTVLDLHLISFWYTASTITV